MIQDLLGQSKKVVLEADVHVIGGGIAGLLVATRLCKKGLRVIVSESGAEHQDDETHPLNEVVHRRSIYSGAARGRFRCLGGTSTRWGGAMIPFLPADLADNSAWPVRHAELMAYCRDVERLFWLPDGPYELPDLAQRVDGVPATHIARLAKWPSFERRNIAVLLRAEIGNASGPQIWLNSTAAVFEMHASGRLESVTCFAPDGARLTVRAVETIVAAGAIESTRLLLLADRQYGNRIFSPDEVLGRYFHDHLSVQVGGIEPSDRRALNRVVGFRFERGGMRNLRFESSEAPEIRARVPVGFAHVSFSSREDSGFEAVRALYRHLQKRRPPNRKVLLGLLRATPWLVQAGWWRLYEQRLLYPSGAAIELHAVIDQIPRASNRITLDATRTDLYGQPLACIDWAVDEEDKQNLTRFTDAFIDLWQHSTLAKLSTIQRLPSGEAEQALSEAGGVYHPGGSTRMGRDASQGVVDGFGRTFRISNLSVVSTSTFPTGGGANPTMMMMMTALRTADAVERRLQATGQG